MEYKKVINFLDDTNNHLKNCETKDLVEINDDVCRINQKNSHNQSKYSKLRC